ncbi:hypothetical protein GW17_00020337 [Ensete ventricosum]|nr:hypothetical protein GW17_00020337 [Ensete ventricosum]
MALSRTALLLLAMAALSLLSSDAAVSAPATKVCVLGSGIGGSSVAHFLKQYTCESATTPCIDDIRIFERREKVGGRMATVTIGGDTFEAGASIIHPKNLHAVRFARLLNLNTKTGDDSDSDPKSNVSSSSSWFGIWDGSVFVFQTLPPPSRSSSAIYRKMYPLLNSLVLAWRYGFSLLRMERFVQALPQWERVLSHILILLDYCIYNSDLDILVEQEMIDRFILYYNDLESRPVFVTVEEMLKWSGLYGLTLRTLQEELADAGLSSRLVSELVTV